MKLLATGRRSLLYGNLFKDCFWGVDGDGTGQNHLGKLLQRVRALAATGADLEAWTSLHAKPVAAERARVTMRVSKDSGVLEERVFDAMPRLSVGKGEDSDVVAAHPTVSRLHCLLLITSQ
ncbi:hypothetical protein B484DRAFT_409071, partial [Ochromonadaceae sp. CCMP2298]